MQYAITIAVLLVCCTFAGAVEPKPLITLTPAAAEQIKIFAQDERLKDWAVRVGVKKADGAFEYSLDLTEEKPTPDDIKSTSLGLTILVDSKASARLI